MHIHHKVLQHWILASDQFIAKNIPLETSEAFPWQQTSWNVPKSAKADDLPTKGL
jgi:hypothetical protein